MKQFTHTTANGETKLIAEMDSEHLKNTIKLILKKYKEAANSIGSAGGITLEMQLLGIYADPDEIKKHLQYLLSVLPPYVLEAMLRGIDLSKEIQDAIGRSEAIPTISNTFRRKSGPEWQILPCPSNDYVDFDPMDYGDR